MSRSLTRPCLYQSLEASVHIPADIFKSVRCPHPVCSDSKVFKLQFVVYKTAKLFPQLGAASADMVVKSSVISAKIGRFQVL